MLNTRRRIDQLEARIAQLEAATAVDMDPTGPILDHRPPNLTTPDEDDDTDWTRGPGLYL